MANCRFCGTPLHRSFVDLGMSPLCESFLTRQQLNEMEPFYPLHALVCEKCFLVQVEEYVTPEGIFSEYAYFSSYSQAWLDHAKAYTDMILSRLGLNDTSEVIELGSNDGYLLQYFVARGIRVLGIEPASNVAASAISRGIPTVTRLFGLETATVLRGEGHHPNLLIGNNVLAQVSDVNGFVAGMKTLLRPGGVITMEFPHLLRLMDENQFDTIYHEHFSYFSLLSAEQIFAAHGLTLFDVEEMLDARRFSTDLCTPPGGCDEARGARESRRFWPVNIRSDSIGPRDMRLSPSKCGRQSGACWSFSSEQNGKGSPSWAMVRRARATRC